MNSINIIGNLTRDPEIRQAGGTDLCVFGIAVNDGFGEKRKTYFFDVNAWGKQCATLEKFLEKGKKVAITGSIRQESWEKDGQRMSKVIINADRVDFLSVAGDSDSDRDESPAKPAAKKSVRKSEPEDEDQELPF